MNSAQKPLVIYHAGCPDGVTAAWVVKKRFGDVDLHPGRYGEPPPDVTSRDVYVVDFTYGDDLTKPSWSPTGYDLCVWMQATGFWPNERPTVHSMNPIGSKRMRDFIEQRWTLPPRVIREVPADEFGRVDMRALFS